MRVAVETSQRGLCVFNHFFEQKGMRPLKALASNLLSMRDVPVLESKIAKDEWKTTYSSVFMMQFILMRVFKGLPPR